MLNHSTYRFWRKLFPYLLLIPSVAILVSMGVYPFVYAIILSLGNKVLTKPWLPARFMGAANYGFLLTDSYFYYVLKTTVIFTLATVGLEFLIGLGLALLLAREFRTRGLFRSLYIVPMVTTPIIVGLTWRFLLYPQYGLITYWSTLMYKHFGLKLPIWLEDMDWVLFTVIMTDVWHWTPFMFLVLSAGLAALPQGPFEAAKVDGAGKWQMFKNVTLPLLKPAIFICFIIRGMDSFRTFDKIYVLTGGGPSNVTELLSIYLYRLTFRFFYVSRGAAAALLMLVMIIAVSWITLKAFRREERI